MASRVRKRMPSASLAKKLGLVQPPPLPRPDRVRLTFHAVQRFRQRVASELTMDDARRALEALVRDAQVVRERPAWLGRESLEERQFTTAAYLIVPNAGPVPFALPVVFSNGVARALTCLVKGG